MYEWAATPGFAALPLPERQAVFRAHDEGRRAGLAFRSAEATYESRILSGRMLAYAMSRLFVDGLVAGIVSERAHGFTTGTDEPA